MKVALYNDMANKNPTEVLLWSIVLPGFGQFLNGKYIKGLALLSLEFLVNVKGHLNEVILLSFQGENEKAIQQADYQWLMFYACLYSFAMWDAYKDAGGGKTPFASLPFVFSVYFVTIGMIYSSKITLFGEKIGPLWLPLLSVIPGLLAGYILQRILRKKLS